MQAGAGHFADRVKAGDFRFAVHVRDHAAALVMRRWHDRDRFLGDVNAVAQAGLVDVWEALDQELIAKRGRGVRSDEIYIRLHDRYADKPGMFAALTEQLGDAGISIDTLIQESAGDSGAAPIAILTHPCPRASVEAALAKIADLKITADTPRLLRIETRA